MAHGGGEWLSRSSLKRKGGEQEGKPRYGGRVLVFTNVKAHEALLYLESQSMLLIKCVTTQSQAQLGKGSWRTRGLARTRQTSEIRRPLTCSLSLSRDQGNLDISQPKAECRSQRGLMKTSRVSWVKTMDEADCRLGKDGEEEGAHEVHSRGG